MKIVNNKNNCRSNIFNLIVISILEINNNANNINFDITRFAYLRPSFFVFVEK